MTQIPHVFGDLGLHHRLLEDLVERPRVDYLLRLATQAFVSFPKVDFAVCGPQLRKALATENVARSLLQLPTLVCGAQAFSQPSECWIVFQPRYGDRKKPL